MRVATWNINGLRARLEFALHWLKERQPDVVGLQELKLTDDQFPREPFEALGYHVASHGQKAWNGVAILSREPARVIQRGLPGQSEMGARLLSAEIGDLLFTTVYCPNGKDIDHEDFPKKLAWFDDLARHFEQVADRERPAILCGDFNVCPAAIDSHAGERAEGQIFHTEEERKRYRSLLECGFTDVFRALHPNEVAFSWWDYRGGAFHRKLGLRIDFLLANATALPRVAAVAIDRDFRKKKDGLTPSDHAPVFADLEFS
ncbi:MAG: exodeoxyribonuclease III [Deltaproteobacteria bacterium]|nr:exodeoxyribonuclease III [Deltaproteobacteria bacterium]MBW2543620.1 exodeoxyribonuclease III [Deltaproteobacteria bacterium]